MIRAKDALETTALIEDLLKDASEAQFRESRHTQAALVAYLAHIGEAVTHIPDDVKQREPDVPWHKIRGMRKILVHVYWEISIDMLWEAGTRSVPALRESLMRLLDQANTATDSP